MLKEIYKDIPGYEGLYQVSDLGNVISLKWGKKKPLKPYFIDDSYSSVSLYKNRERKIIMVHQLVAMAFLNHKTNGHKTVLDHINNIKTDNRLVNIQITTNRVNSSKDRKGGYSEYTGVCWNKVSKKWVSHIRINGKHTYLGSFICEIQAYKAYQEALKRIT